MDNKQRSERVEKILKDGLSRLKDTNVPPSVVGNNVAFLFPFLATLTEEVMRLSGPVDATQFFSEPTTTKKK